MARPPRLSTQAIESGLVKLPKWTLDGNAIVREFQFPTFVAAWAFMSKVALLAEKMDHHPDWHNVYNRVDVSLSTHDAGGITEMDMQMAMAIDGLL